MWNTNSYSKMNKAKDLIKTELKHNYITKNK